MLVLHKLVVQAVIAERDEDGNSIGEQPQQAVPLYTQAQIEEYFSALNEQLAAVNAEASAAVADE